MSATDFSELTEEDWEEYNSLKTKSFLIRLIFFLILFPVYIILIIEALNTPYSVFRCLGITVIYFGLFWILYIVRFAGKPVGILYGRISKKTVEKLGRYHGYRYNVYIESIDETIKNIQIPLTKECPVIMKNDSVKIVKTRLGALYVWAYK